MSEDACYVLTQTQETGDRQKHELLFGQLYGDLQCMAKRQLRRRAAELTLGPATLLHETFLNLSGRETMVFADDRQFMAYASRAMRGLIVDYLRRRSSEKRGGRLEITPLPTEPPFAATLANDALQIERVNTALESLAQIDAPLAELVELRYFCGLPMNEIACLREVSERTVERDWQRARLLLGQLIDDRAGAPPSAA